MEVRLKYYTSNGIISIIINSNTTFSSSTSCQVKSDQTFRKPTMIKQLILRDQKCKILYKTKVETLTHIYSQLILHSNISHRPISYEK